MRRASEMRTLLVILLASVVAACATIPQDREITLIRKYEKCVRESSAQPGDAASNPFRCDPIRDQIEALKRKQPVSQAPVSSANSSTPAASPQVKSELRKAARMSADRHYTQAVKAYSRILEHDPNNLQALVGRGNALAAQRKFNKAMADYNRALAVNPRLAAALNNRAIVEYAQGHESAARRDMGRAEQLAPGDSTIRRNNTRVTEVLKGNANAKALLNQKHFDEAITTLNKSLAGNPGNEAALRYRGIAKLLKGDVDGAVTDLTAALKHNPKDIAALYYRADAYAHKGERQLAIKDLERAAAIEPSNKLILNALQQLKGGS